MSEPSVSVIIPNYNHAHFLDERIRSVLNQTYQNFEVIILDDRSTDNSVEVINKYKDNPHITQIILNEENSGSTFKQWQKGFEIAKGEWIWIAESDDYCDFDFLASLMQLVDGKPEVAIAYCSSQFVDAEGTPISYIYPKSNKAETFEGKKFIKQKLSTGNAIVNASSAIFRKKFAILTDEQYINYVAAGDKLFWIELAEMGSVIYLSSPKNFFRQHNNKVSPQKLLFGITFKEDYKILRYIEKKKIVSVFRGIYVRSYYLALIRQMIFANDSIKKELQKMWSYNNLIPLRFFYIYGKYFKKMMCLDSLILNQLKKYHMIK